MKSNYYRFSEYLKERFGCRVHRVSIDAGFSCPNRDGTINRDGCIYCDNKGFSFNTRNPTPSVETQIKEGIDAAKKRFNAKKFIIYFQAYTNTYGSLEILKGRYNIVRGFDDIVGISIGTRPDCINEEILNLIEAFSKDYEMWLEYGLQSIHNRTLNIINRGHYYEDFLRVVELTKKKKNIKICGHVIIGLPLESKSDILETAKAIGSLKLDGIKIHPLHIIKGTTLEEFYNRGQYKVLELNEYIELVCDFLEYLWPKTVIQRITADCPKEYLIAPPWILDKNRVIREIDKRLETEGRYQGRLWEENEILHGIPLV